MKTLLPWLLLFLAGFLVAIQAKIYGRCELAKKMNDHEMDGYQGYSLANWVCMAFFESGFDTGAVGQRKDGTSDFGIFQINSGWWCVDGESSSENLCELNCKELLHPDIEHDIICAKRIVQDPQGMEAWNEWKTHCAKQDLQEWVKGCPL